MKILQVTHFGTTTNYGQVLQSYALQQALERLGHHPVLLQADFDFSLSKPAWYKGKLYNAWRRSQRKRRRLKEEKQHPRKFDEFIGKYMHATAKRYFSVQELLQERWDEYEAFIVGSDQVWARWCLDELFTLEFAPARALKASYSASAGTSLTDDTAYRQRLSKMLTTLNGGISVRDNATLALLGGLTDAPVSLVPDPTWLLTPEDYRQAFALPVEQALNKDACFVYLVNRESEELIPSLLEYCARNGKSLRVVTSRKNIITALQGKAELIYPTIEEWLRELSSASLVVADSFHGTAFALNFNRQLVVPAYMAEDIRFQTMHQHFDFSRVYCKELPAGFNGCTLDWQKVNPAKAAFVQQGWDFLNSISNA